MPPERAVEQKTVVPVEPAGVDKAVPGPHMAAVHHAAQEMALDGFQFGKKSLGWPFDAGVKSSADYLSLLVRDNYLPAGQAAESGSLIISNLSDSDPGETAFLRTAFGVSPVVVVRKDGRTQSFAAPSACDGFAPPPPREPAWLP